MFRLLVSVAALAILTGCGESHDVIAPAQAQSTPAQLQTLDPEYLKQLANQGSSAGVTGNGAATTKEAAASTKLVIGGWNFVLPSYCVGQYIGSSFYIYVVGRDGSITWTNDPNAVATISPACVSGAGMGFQVVSASGTNFVWRAVATYHP